MSPYKIISLFWLICTIPCFAQNEALLNAVKEFRDDAWIRQCQWGFSAKNLSTGQNIVSENPDSLLIPASVTKIFSSASALHFASPEYRFLTLCMLSGEKADSGIWKGDLIVYGSGDPSMGYELPGKDDFFTEISKELHARGIKKIDGKILADASLFGPEIIPPTYPEDDRGNYYGAGCSALNFNGNEMELHFQTFGTNTPVKLVKIIPEFSDFILVNNCTAGKPGTSDNSVVYGDPFEMKRRIEGSIPPGKSDFIVGASSPDPALGFAIMLQTTLESKGITISEKPGTVYSARTYSTSDTLVRHLSAPLGDLLQYIVTRSHNPSAEILFRLSGKFYAGDYSYISGQKAVMNYIDALGIECKNIHLNDGSGLSKANKISTSAMVDFLSLQTSQPWFAVWEKSLPLAGKTGTLKNMFKGTAADGNIRAKTGYMKTVRAYAGYATNPAGEKIAFCFIVNYYGGNSYALKKKIEELLVLLCE